MRDSPNDEVGGCEAVVSVAAAGGAAAGMAAKGGSAAGEAVAG